jgi:PleD family two-component response regulator
VPDSKTLKLLVVEDSVEDEQLLCEALLEIEENRQWCNWRTSSIVPVDRLADALECLRSDSFDAVLLNLSLPDSPTLLNSFFQVSACAGATPILILADEPDETLANRLLREGAQDVVVKSELECAPFARAIRFAIERQRRASAAQVSAIVDPLTGVLTRAAFLMVAACYGPLESLALVKVAADGETLDPILIEMADELRNVFKKTAIVGRWDSCRFCILAGESALRRAAPQLSSRVRQFSITSIEGLISGEEATLGDQVLSGQFPLRAKTAMLAD